MGALLRRGCSISRNVKFFGSNRCVVVIGITVYSIVICFTKYIFTFILIYIHNHILDIHFLDPLEHSDLVLH